MKALSVAEERKKDYMKKYYSENREHIIKTSKKNYNLNLEKKRSYGRNYSRKWRVNNPSYFKEYFNANREKFRIYNLPFPIL